ncbi:uncharacterized protein LOC114518983 isoform X2 [Dendronephthya gigantea]|uniref:uncharacterized protein LOC114518983 isoform X2 n=1 Tax=Dendronephthya gigantea TaxID=151771 RepID=UPI00106C2A30|nr:uncharacterized protein LOC114518983 isoform X2 [Dendronephthya gigantea]
MCTSLAGIQNDGFVDETVHVVCPTKLKTEKKYKEQKSKEITVAICAMLNSNGGKVRLSCKSKSDLCESLKSSVSRMLEQLIISIVGPRMATSKICMKDDEEGLVIHVKKADYLITTSYNLYLPSQTQVVQLNPREPLKNVLKDIMDRRVVSEPVKLGSHQNIFRRGQDSGLSESKMCQLKDLKSDQSKRTTLADRMTGKSNKFSCYVSAFANYRGGHIYYGITDESKVEGEVISYQNDRQEIIKKVQKSINKMIWPEYIGQPKRGEHWDIFFESVLDENSTIIPSIFVIVIYIAYCFGGVFTEEPECYEMVDGKIRKMTFIAWMERIHYDKVLRSRSIKRITWSSNKIRSIYTFLDHVLSQKLNTTGKSIQKISKSLESKYPRQIKEVRLFVGSKKIKFSYRTNDFRNVEKLLEQYEALQIDTTDFAFFDAILAYIKLALYRVKGKSDIPIETLISNALSKAEMIEPGLTTAAIYLLVATMTSSVSEIPGYMATILGTTALEHLQYVHDSPIARADLEQEIHISLALHHLGYNAYRMQTEKTIDSKDLDKAKSSLAKVDKLISEGNSVNNYRNTRLNLAKAYHRNRQSEIHPDESLLKEAFQFSKQAENLATEDPSLLLLRNHAKLFCKDNVSGCYICLYAKACTALCTQIH